MKNKSGSTSVQVTSKERGKYKVVKTIGSTNSEQEIQKLVFLARLVFPLQFIVFWISLIAT
ncbi:MAG: hypothetical protein ABIP35_07245 [Ginsengibacter sp.]